MMPTPKPPLEIFEPTFRPGSESVPTDQSLLGIQIGQDDPSGLIAGFPVHQQGSIDPPFFAGKAFHLALPTRSRRGDPSTDPLKVLLSRHACFAAHIDA